MKSKILVFIAVAMLVSGLSWVLPYVGHKGDALPRMTAFASSQDIQVTINGQPVLFDVQPQYSSERIYVPFRKLLEALGAAVEWDQEQKVATATKDGLAVKIPLGSEKIYMQEHVLQMDVPVIMIDDRTLVPLRFAAQALGARVDWTKEAGGERIVITQSYDVMIDRLVNGKTEAGDMKVNYEQAAILFEWLYKGQEKGELPEFTGSMPVRLPAGSGYFPLSGFGEDYLKYWDSISPNGGVTSRVTREVFTKIYRFQEDGMFEKKEGEKVSSYILVGNQTKKQWDQTRGELISWYYPN